MQLHSPFFISSRLAPAIRIGDAVLSYDPTAAGNFALESDDQTLSHVFMVNFPQCRIAGATDESELQDAFHAALSFLSEGENSDLFPSEVGQWAEDNSDALSLASLELETRGLIGPDAD